MDIVFTIVAPNYIAYANTLMSSVKQHHPDALRFIVVCGSRSSLVEGGDDAQFIFSSDLDISDLGVMSFYYDVMEFATAIKPQVIIELRRRFPESMIVYLDPDILVLRPLDHVFGPLYSGASLVLTPHMTKPLQDGKDPDDLTIMKSGIFNLGFCAVGQSQEAMDFVRWWRDRCKRGAIVDIHEHFFTDQRWVDLAPAFVDKLKILRHPGYNLAYWNLLHTRIHSVAGEVFANSEYLHFVHFSGVVPGDKSIFSKHQNRFDVSNIGDLAEIHADYIQRLKKHGWERTRSAKYEYDYFSNGRRISRLMRRSFRRHLTSGLESENTEPRAGDGAIFDSIEPSLKARGAPFITRVMFELWLSRDDLRAHFDVSKASGRGDFGSWFVDRGFEEAQVDGDSIAAARRLAQGATRVAPWKVQLPLGPDCATSRRDWLAEPVALNVQMFGAGVAVPRLLALVWESRRDLKAHFPCRTQSEIDDYLTWCLTSGSQEGAIDLDLVAGSLAPFLRGSDQIFPVPSEWPQPRLLRLVFSRFLASDDANLPFTNPTELAYKALLTWIRGGADRRFRWPPWVTEQLTAFLEQVPPYFDGLGLPLSRYLQFLWEVRPQLQSRYDVSTPAGALAYLAWFVFEGHRELNLPTEALPASLATWLKQVVRLADGSVSSRLDALHRLDRSSHFGNAPEEKDEFGSLSPLQIKEKELQVALASPAKPHVRKIRFAPSVCLSGQWDVPSGLGEALKSSSSALTAVGVDHLIFDVRSEKLYHPGGQLALGYDPSSITCNIIHMNADTALFDFIKFKRNRISHAYQIGYWAWELETMPSYWRHAFGVCDEIWASSKFSYDAFDSEKLRKVSFVPQPVGVAGKGQVKRNPHRSKSFSIFFAFDLRSYVARKNPEAVIEAFQRAFSTGTEEVELWLKILGADTKQAELERILERTGKDARIRVTTETLSQSEIFDMMQSASCFISLHRSEGFGRGIAEAMALGTPVICTGYSGNSDFATEETAFLVPYTLVPVRREEYPGVEGQRWAEPDVSAAAEHLLTLYKDRRVGAAKARVAKSAIGRTNSPEAVGKVMKQRLAENGLLPARPTRNSSGGMSLRQRTSSGKVNEDAPTLAKR